MKTPQARPGTILPIAVMAFAIVAFLVLVYWSASNRSAETAVSTNTSTDATAEWKTYTNNKIGYSIKLPTGWNPVSEFDGSTVPFEGTNDMVTFSKFGSAGVDTSFVVQACSLVAPYTCNYHSVQDWKTQMGFTPSTAANLSVSGFDVGRDSSGRLNYLQSNTKNFVYIYVSQAAEKKVQDILSTFTFTK